MLIKMLLLFRRCPHQKGTSGGCQKEDVLFCLGGRRGERPPPLIAK
jgi:hypothetical protein